MPMPLETPGAILVIDDDPNFVKALALLLRRDGSTVDTAADGPGALGLLQARHYDIILCDVDIPALDGPAFYTLLARQYPALCPRVIFFTSDTLRAERLAFLGQCRHPWLAKPCTITAIRSMIAHT
jgi:CheY-like chemotaxis protein